RMRAETGSEVRSRSDRNARTDPGAGRNPDCRVWRQRRHHRSDGAHPNGIVERFGNFSRIVRDLLWMRVLVRQLVLIVPKPAGAEEAGTEWGGQMRVRVLLIASVSAAFVIEGGRTFAQDATKDAGSYTTELPAIEVSPARTAARPGRARAPSRVVP